MEFHFEHMLKQKNLSLTAVRLAVLQALHTCPHSDASAIFDLVKKRIATTSMQAIYNNLNTLVEHGIIREIKPKGQPSLYETQTGDNHHHMVCRRCQSIMDAHCSDDVERLSPMNNHGFAIDEAEIIFWGTCPTCQTLK